MPNMRWADKEEEQLANDFADGKLTLAEYNKAMRELHREVRNAIEDERDERHRQIDREYDGW